MNAFTQSVREELARARQLNARMNSAHEGYAVILEEVDELWEEVRKKRSARDPRKMYAELVQIAAMAQRMAEDLILKSGPQRCASEVVLPPDTPPVHPDAVDHFKIPAEEMRFLEETIRNGDPAARVRAMREHAKLSEQAHPEMSATWRKLVKPIFFAMYRDEFDEVVISRRGTEVTLKIRRHEEPSGAGGNAP